MSDKPNSENQTGKNILSALGKVMTPDNLQNYVLGYKKNGKPRAIYDVIKDQTEPKRGGGSKGKKRKPDKFSLYISPVKKKKKNKKKDHWRWDD